MEFDAAGYLTSLTRANGTALAQITTYTRNAGELLTSITDPLGRTTAMTYNSAGDVLTRTFLSGTPNAITYTYTYTPNYHQIASVKDPLGNTTTYGYTGGCLTSVTDPLGHTTMVSCNGAGQPVAMTDALGHTTTLTYSGSDLQTITDPLSRATTFTSDNLGRTIAVRDPLGRLARVSYDKNGLVTQSVDLLGQATTYAYDGNGNLLSVTDPNGGKTQFSYDARNRRTSRTDALGQAESWTYDAMGNVATFTDRKGQQTSYEYDALNRISKITYADASTVIPTYDTAGRTTQLVDTVSGTITRSYDALDRLTQEQTSQGSVTYTYDTVGRRATMTPGSQGQISYTYDNADRLTQISQGTEAVAFGYDNANRRTSVTLPNGVVTSYTYDTADQLTGITYATGSGTTLSSLAYTYDAAGQRLSQIGSFLADVLPTATIGTNIFDLNNRQTKWNGVVLGYDKNGDPTANVAANQSYTFDARQQLTQIQDSGTGATLAAFTYDALGRRTSKTIGTTATSFLYDGLDTVQEAQGSNTYSVLTGLGIDERFARSEVGGRYYFLTDALGSTLALTDSSAVVQQKYAYEPYGEMTSTGSSNNPYQFTGRENDSTGLYYYRARYYSPRLKRFISEDPKGLAAGLNSYAYVGGNPVSLVDPNGLEGVGPWTFAPGPDRDGYYASLRCSQRFGERVNRRFIETHNFFPGFFAPPGMGLLLGSGRAAATALGVPTLTEAAGLQVVNSLISEPLYINWSGAFRGASLSYFGVAAAWESGLYTGTVIYVGLTDSDCGCSR
jgi:RHS repeat-associated protein